MIKHSTSFLLLLLLFSSSTNFSMQQQLMQRHNAGKSDSQDIIEKTQEKSFSDLTFKEITEGKCVICYDKLETHDKALAILPCHHALHDNCFTKLKKYNFTNCPSCRAKINYPQEDYEGNENNCIMCMIKSKSLIIGCIEKLSDDFIKESHNLMTNPNDYVEEHMFELRSFLSNIWGSHGDE